METAFSTSSQSLAIPPTRLAVLLGQTDGGFTTTLYSPAALGQILLLPNGSPTPDIVLGHGGYVDGGWTESGFTLLKNSGHGTFDDSRSYEVSGGAWLAIGDFNGDCILDLATTHIGSDGCQADWQTSVLYGDGDGGFGDPQIVAAGASRGPWDLATLGPKVGPQTLGVNNSCSSDFTLYGHAGGD